MVSPTPSIFQAINRSVSVGAKEPTRPKRPPMISPIADMILIVLSFIRRRWDQEVWRRKFMVMKAVMGEMKCGENEIG